MWDGRWVFYADEISGNLLPGIIEMCGMESDVVWFVMHELWGFSLPIFHPELIHSKPDEYREQQIYPNHRKSELLYTGMNGCSLIKR